MTTLSRAFMAPVRYWQGPGELDRIGERLEDTPGAIIVVMSPRTRGEHGERLRASLARRDATFVTSLSACTDALVDALTEQVVGAGADLVVAVGGGTITDTAKAAAHRAGARVVVVPTLASTDAPTAAAAVIYDGRGAVASIETYPAGPYAVVVDTDIIASAPLRYLVAGMGDAMATAYEARAATLANATTIAGGVGTRAATAIAEQCRTTLLAEATEAIRFVRTGGGPREPFEAVVEANILLSGLGFESGGLAAAHAVHNGLVPHAREDALHGELVAYGLLVHLALIGDMAELERVLAFHRSVGLPVSAEQVGVPIQRLSTVTQVAERACDPRDSMRNMPMAVTPHDVIQAVVVVEDSTS